LARLKGNYQLTQIVNAESYSDWIRLVAAFSLRQDWTDHANSLFYVMMLWSRLVAAIPYLDRLVVVVGVAFACVAS
jgi:exportin-7